MKQNDHNESPFFRFEELRIYSKSLDFTAWVYQLTENYPVELRRKLIVVTENIACSIAEGSARNKPQFIYYLKQAKSNVRECIVLLSIADRLELISSDDLDYSRSILMELTKMLGAFISSIYRGPKYSGEDHDNEDFEIEKRGFAKDSNF